MTDSQLRPISAGLDRASVESLAQRWLQALNSHDPEQVVALCAPDVVFSHSTWPTTMRGHDDVWAWFTNNWRAVPDMRVELADGPFPLPDQPKVAYQWRIIGTHTGMWDPPGLAATGERFDVVIGDFHEYRDGKVVRGTGVMDITEVLRQLKVMPPQGSRAERRMMRLLNLQTRLRRLLRR